MRIMYFKVLTEAITQIMFGRKHFFGSLQTECNKRFYIIMQILLSCVEFIEMG